MTAITVPRLRRSRRRPGDNRWTVGWILRRLPYWIAALFLAGAAFLWIYPFLWMVSASLKDQLEVFASGLGLLPDNPIWANYERAWTEASFGKYLINTVIVTVATVVIVVVRCAMAGYVLARHRFAGRKLVLGVLIATLFVPTGYTIIPVVEVSQRLGLLNSLTGMILALSGGAHVASVLLYMGYFRQLPRELEEAAIVDGAGFLSLFFRVMLPMALPVTATVTLMTFLATWNAFFLPLVFTFSRPDLVISLLPVVLLFVLLQRYFVEGIAGAVKQ
jgi:ABC-type glycerol-3-phosphate transport system permease component